MAEIFETEFARSGRNALVGMSIGGVSGNGLSKEALIDVICLKGDCFFVVIVGNGRLSLKSVGESE